MSKSKKWFVVFDKGSTEFLKKFNAIHTPGKKEYFITQEWETCYHVGTMDIKFKDDLPFLFKGRRAARKAITLINKEREEKLDLHIYEVEEVRAVIIDWSS